MSTGKTERIGLHQWEPQDDFLRSEFNEDNAKIDATFRALYAQMEQETDRVNQAAEKETQRIDQAMADETERVNVEIARIDSSMGAETTRINAELGGKQPFISASGLLKGDGNGGIHAAAVGSDYVAPWGSISGNAGSATQLASARYICTNLGSPYGAAFNGTADAYPGVTGVLPPANGGTGVNDLQALRSALGCVRTEMGTYTGTGVYGQANPTVITFSFVPLFVVVMEFWNRDFTSFYINNGTVTMGGMNLSATLLGWINDRTLFFYYDTDGYQLNKVGRNYLYIAIG